MPHLLSNDKSGKMIDMIEFKYFINGAAFMGNPVSIFDKKIDQGLNYHNSSAYSLRNWRVDSSTKGKPKLTC